MPCWRKKVMSMLIPSSLILCWEKRSSWSYSWEINRKYSWTKFLKQLLLAFLAVQWWKSIAVFMEYISMHKGSQGVNSGLDVYLFADLHLWQLTALKWITLSPKGKHLNILFTNKQLSFEINKSKCPCW